MEVAPGEKGVVGERKVVEEASVDKATSSQNFLVNEINVVGPKVRTRNKTKM